MVLMFNVQQLCMYWKQAALVLLVVRGGNGLKTILTNISSFRVDYYGHGAKRGLTSSKS